MRVKKFRASTQSAALARARSELGPEAVLLGSRRVSDREGLARGERVEVTVAVDWEPTAERRRTPRASSITRAIEKGGPPSPSRTFDSRWTEPPERHRADHRDPAVLAEERIRGAGPVAAGLQQELRELRRMVRQLATSSVGPDELPLDEVYRAVYAELVANEVERSLALKVVRGVGHRLSPAKPASKLTVADAVQASLRRLLPPPSPSAKRVVALLGPTGVGKTTTAAKLAARMLLAGKKPVTLITIDTFRAAAVEQLRVYAGAMGAQFEAARDLEELQESFERHRGAAQLIVDTEGRGQRDLEGLRPLFGFLRARPEVERHLVLSATTKAMDLEETVERFRAAAPDRLLFTKVDETGSYGPILSESVRSGLPVSYLGTGQRIPDELLIATPEKLAELALSSLS